MKRLCPLIFCLCGSLWAVPFVDILSEDSQLVVAVQSTKELRDKWDGHVLNEAWESGGLAGLGGGASDATEIADESFVDLLYDEFGLEMDELFDLFPGQLAVSVYNLGDLMLDQSDAIDFVVLLECAGDAERLDELMGLEFERQLEMNESLGGTLEFEHVEESFIGESLHYVKVYDGLEESAVYGYALVDGILLFSLTEERLELTIEAIKEGPEAALSESAAYLAAREKSGPSDLACFVNLDALAPELNEALLDVELPPQWLAFGVTAQTLIKALSLEELESMYLDAALEETGARIHGGYTLTSKGGVAGLMSFGEGGLPEPAYVPEGVFSSMVSRFDQSAMFRQVESMLNIASPAILPLMELALMKYKGKSGIDVRAAFTENFGSEMVTFSMLNEAGLGGFGPVLTEEVYLFEIKDSALLSEALEIFKGAVPMLREAIKVREFDGHTIYSLPGRRSPNFPDEGAYDFSYTVTRDKLIVSLGRVSLLQTVLSRMNEADGGFWQADSTRALFDRIAMPGAVTRSYHDFGAYLRRVREVYRQALEQSGAGASAAESISDVEAPYHVISEFNEFDNGFDGRVMLITDEGDAR